MNLEFLKTSHSDILGCEIKDKDGLNDFQKLPNSIGISIPKVGIERFRIPLNFINSDGALMGHDVEASMFVNLEAGKTGVNMSRFCQILQDEGVKKTVNNDFFKTVLNRFKTELRDSDSEKLINNAFLDLSFNYATKQKSLRSGNWGYQYYKVEWSGHQNKFGDTIMSLTLNYEYSSTCPCSLSMAKQYEEEYRAGKTEEGNGIAVAHGQRSNACVKIEYSLDNPLEIEEFIKILRAALPTETQSLVKRADEQAFAILNGDNPMFVEHASRRLKFALDSYTQIKKWEAKVEHFESLHSHNAVAFIQSENYTNPVN